MRNAMNVLAAGSKVRRGGLRVPLWSTINRYKITSWLNKKKCEPMFGIAVHMPVHGWCNFAEDGKALFFATERDAERKIAALKAEFKAGRKAITAGQQQNEGGG